MSIAESPALSVPAAPARIRFPRLRLWHLLAFARIPGNALSFRIRATLCWSRGRPTLWQEDKRDLFRYLGPGGPAALEREADLSRRYRLAPLKALSTASLYRKNLYLLDCLERAGDGLPPCAPPGTPLRAADVGAGSSSSAIPPRSTSGSWSWDGPRGASTSSGKGPPSATWWSSMPS